VARPQGAGLIMARRTRIEIALAAALTVVALLVSLIAAPASRPDVHPKLWDPAFDGALRRAFAAPGDDEAKYDLLFCYFVTSFVDRERPGGSRADQPGAPSRHGRDVDALESFSRLAPMVGAWLASGRPAVIRDLRGKDVDLRRLLHDGIVNGTTPDSPAYWGQMSSLDQRIVEAADVARTLFIIRSLGVLSPPEVTQAARWLQQSEHLRVPDNNWHLYPVLIGTVLTQLGQPYDKQAIDAHWRRFLEFYRGDGWFSDGPGADFDFYNAWAIHYELFWLRRIVPGFGGAPVSEAMRAFVATFPYLLGPKGIPILGRSVCYRMAAPAPLVAAALPAASPDSAHVDPGLARHALDDVWSYFIAHGAVADGVATQGYCGPDLRVLDDYSGPASCLWALRSVTLAFLAPPGAPFWTAQAQPLPVERRDYRIAIPAIGWTIEGKTATGDVRIVRGAGVGRAPALEGYVLWRRAATAVLWRPFRPDNHTAKYDAPVYSSAHPFCGCAGPAAARPGSGS
jgi:hypothetical protein